MIAGSDANRVGRGNDAVADRRMSEAKINTATYPAVASSSFASVSVAARSAARLPPRW